MPGPACRRPARTDAAPCLAALLLLLVAQVAHGASSSPAHGGDKGKGKGKGDGYSQPYSKNAAWKYYKFDVLNKDFEFTSVRLMPAAGADTTQPGTIATVMGALYDAKGEQIGINQWTRTVVGDDLVLGSQVDRVVTALISVQYEFGTKEDGYFDDTLAVSLVSKRPTAPGAEFADYDGVITGGTGKFLGATGRITVSDAVFDEDEPLVTASAMVRFDVYVPNNLPPMAP